LVFEAKCFSKNLKLISETRVMFVSGFSVFQAKKNTSKIELLKHILKEYTNKPRVADEMQINHWTYSHIP
jgi:hypothetical protein